MVFQACKEKEVSFNQFSSSTDTLIIKAKKKKGTGLFLSSSFPLIFKELSEGFDYSIAYPEHISNVKRCQKVLGNKGDTYYLMDIIKGKVGNKEVFIVDENNNRDLTDDTLRVSKEIKWYSSEQLIKCNYFIHNGNKRVNDYSWIQLRKVGNGLWMSRKDYVEGSFSIDNDNYKIGAIDLRNALLTYDVHPEIALLSNNLSIKDTLLSKDVLRLNEYLKLKDSYYRFAEISKLGKEITLVKEKDFKNKVGTQVGMLAPNFMAATIKGDTIKSKALHDKVTVIANACGCGGDKMSTQAIYDIASAYTNKINIFVLDSKIDKYKEGFFIDVEEAFNKDVFEKYRNEYCSRTCYVIDKKNRIIDKFEVTNWKLNLPKLLN